MITKKKISVFNNNLQFYVSNDDWKFMCEHRFYTDNPKLDEIQAEFVSGTGITQNKKNLWAEASDRFTEYVQDLREICDIDVNAMARAVLSNEEKYV